MARGVYVLKGQGMTVVGGIVTLAALRPDVTAAIEILRVWVSQDGSATSAMQAVELFTQVATFPTVVAATPEKTSRSDQASVIAGGAALVAGTGGINASAEGAGAKTVIIPDSFNVLDGWVWRTERDGNIILPASYASCFGVHLPVAPATLTRWNVGIMYRELA